MKKIVLPLMMTSVMPFASAHAESPKACTLEYAPVCGVDPVTEKQKTYGNKCAMETAGARSCDSKVSELFAWAQKYELTTAKTLEQFRANDFVSREEVALIIERAFHKNLFADRPITLVSYHPEDSQMIGEEFLSAIYFVRNAGIMYGNNDKFFPKNHLTHLEAMLVILRSADANADYATKNHPWYTEYINAFNQKITTETSEKFLNSPISRKDFFAWMMEFSQKTPTKTEENFVLNGKWNLESFEAKNVQAKNVVANVEFDKNHIHAKFCNTMNGEVTYANGKIQTKGLASTRMLCDDENLMNAEIAFDLDGAKFELDKANTELTITTKEGAKYVFAKK